MKKRMFTFVMLLAAVVFAEPSSLRPESAIPTPAEKSEISSETPDFSAHDSEEWQKMRAERREARRQILSDLRNSSAAEKNAIRQNVTKESNGIDRIEGERSEKIQPRDHETFYEWQEPRGQFVPPPPAENYDEEEQATGWGHHKY